MRILCLSSSPSSEQIAAFGEGYFCTQSFHVQPGTTYTVLGLTFYVRSQLYGTGVTAEIADDDGHLVTVPLCLFEIVDGRASRHWVVRAWDDGTTALWPASFFSEFYRDDLSEGVSEATMEYERVRGQIEAETITPDLRLL